VLAGEDAMAGRLYVMLALVTTMTVPCGALAQPKPALDFGFYRSHVEPIFLAKKEGHTRCVVCHAESNNNFRLEKLPSDAKAWTEEQSRKNFAMVEKLVNPGDPDTSLLTTHPLAPEAGGHAFHSGGRQFMSKDDPDWQVLVQFVNGAK
jgi:hypothetical protein